MDPVFASAKRRLSDLEKEWGRLKKAKEALAIVQASELDDETKSWMSNAALSAGVSGIYTGMEEILKGLLSAVDDYVPSGASFHQDILDQASIEIESLRPAIISDEVHTALTGLKGFRHFERHNYRFRFDVDQVTRNLQVAERIVPKFIADINGFTANMSTEPKADEDPGPRP